MLLLLHHMRQFMSQQSLPVPGLWGRCAGSEDDVAANGKSLGIDLMCSLSGSLIGVNPHTTEVAGQSSLHQRPEARLKGLTR